MAWHEFQPGDRIRTTAIVAACERYIASGEVKNPGEKERYLSAIARNGSEYLTYRPRGSGWGSSPMNPRVWVRDDGTEVEKPASDKSLR